MKSRVLDLLGVPAYHPQGFSRVGRQTRLFEGGGAEIYDPGALTRPPPPPPLSYANFTRLNNLIAPNASNMPTPEQWQRILAGEAMTIGDTYYSAERTTPSGSGENYEEGTLTGRVMRAPVGSNQYQMLGSNGVETYDGYKSKGFFGDMFSHAASIAKDTAPVWLAALGANYLAPGMAGAAEAAGTAAAGTGAGASTVGITGAEAAAMGAFDAAAGAGAAGSAALPAAVDYSLASTPAASSGLTAPLASTAGPGGATNYSLATQPVYGAGNGLALGTSPAVGTGNGLALAAGASPALGAPSSFVNALTTPAAMTTPAATPATTAAPAAAPAATAATGAANAAAAASPFAFLGPAAASLLGSYLSGESAESAARVSAEAADKATALQQRIYEESIARQQPFLAGGTEDYNRLRSLTSGGPEAAQNFLTMDPGYKFRLSEGMKALDRQAAARGGLISGNALKATQRYGQDLASQEFGNAYNRLARLADVGPQAAGVMSTLGQNYASNVGNITMGQGNTSANALLARGSAYQRGLGDIASLYGRMYGPQLGG